MDDIMGNKVIGHPAAYIDIKGLSGVYFVPGKKGNALCSDGVHEDIVLHGTESSCISHPWKCAKSGMTTLMWVKFFHSDATIRHCFSARNGGLRITHQNLKLIVAFATGYTYYRHNQDFDINIILDTWMHVGVTFSEENGYKLYIDGNLQPDVPCISLIAQHKPGHVHIGFSPKHNNSHSECCIDEIHSWSEIKSHSFITDFINQYR